MLGDVVKLFLCSSCKGLFILDSQVEKHAEYCNGDAFKSPANLFACERDHYLELITPNTPTSKANKTSQISERKRRKTSPHLAQASGKSESRETRRSFLSKDDLSTLSSGTYYGMVTQHIPDTQPHSDSKLSKTTKTSTRSQSLPKISCQQNNVSFTGSETVQCSGQQNVFNAVVSRSVSLSQPYILPVTDETRTLTSSFSLDESDTSYSPNLPRSNNTHENLDSGESDSTMVQARSTPATNLLAYLGQLQHVEPSASETEVHVQQEESLSLTQNPFISNEQNDLYDILSGQTVDRTSVLEGLTLPASVHQNTSEASQHATIDASGILKLDDFQFKPIATVTHIGDFDKTSQDTSGTESIQDILRVDSENDHEEGRQSSRPGSDSSVSKGSVIHSVSDQTGTQVYSSATLTNTSNSGTNMCIQDDIDSNLMSVFQVDHAKSVEPFQTVCQNESQEVHAMDMDSVMEVQASLKLKDDTEVQRPVVYILEPDGIIRTVAVDDILNKNSEMGSSLTTVDVINTDSIVDQSGQQVSQSVALTVDSHYPVTVSTSSPVCQLTRSSSAVKASPSAGGDTDNLVKGGKTVTKPKSKAQIRLEELSALREEILLQATEIPPDAESKKTCYQCNVCGHVAKSVKFMHNHLQMHSDGKVYFECDQCDFKSRLRSKLAEHQQRHSRSRFLCHQCPATFMDLASLKRHVTVKHTDNEDLKCDQCDFKACYAGMLKEHMMKHTGDQFSCDVEGCGYKTAYLRALRSHQKRHINDKKYSCSLCGYRAVEKATLDRHMKSHTQDRPYQCSSCSFRATTRYGVVFHMQHKHQQPQNTYACDKCDFQTTYASSMATHVKTHLGTFSCPLCQHTTRTLPSIKKHLQQLHQVVNVEVVESRTKINTKDYLCVDSRKPPMTLSDKPGLESLMTDTMDSEDLPPLPMADLERTHIDPMKLSFHFQDLASGPFMPSTSGTNLTRSSSIPDLFTFSGMNRTTSQSDLLNFPGISTMTRSNSMSDLVSFASSMCADSGEPMNMDVSLADASASTMDVGGLSLGDGTDTSLTDSVRLGSPAGLMLVLQCSKCLALLMNEEDVDSHKKTCTGTVLMV